MLVLVSTFFVQIANSQARLSDRSQVRMPQIVGVVQGSRLSSICLMGKFSADMGKPKEIAAILHVRYVSWKLVRRVHY